MKKIIIVIILLALPLAVYSQEQTQQAPAAKNSFQQAKSHYSKGEWQAAIPLFKKAAKENPSKEDEALFFIGMCLLKQENAQGAVDNFSKALTLRDSYMQARVKRGEAYMALKQYDPALADFAKILETNPGNLDILYQTGLAHYFKDNYTESINSFNKVLEARPQDANLHYYIGWVYYKQKAYDKTIYHFQTYVKLCPDCPEADKIREILRTLQGG